MTWDEFVTLLSGLGPDTPLGRIIAIRSEDQADTLRYFSKDQHKLRDDWRKKELERKKEFDKENRKEPIDPYAGLTTMFKGMLGDRV